MPGEFRQISFEILVFDHADHVAWARSRDDDDAVAEYYASKCREAFTIYCGFTNYLWIMLEKHESANFRDEQFETIINPWLSEIRVDRSLVSIG